MKTKTQIINEINEVPEILEGFRDIHNPSMRKLESRLNRMTMPSFLHHSWDGFALRTIQSKDHERTIIERFERMSLVKTILKKHPELEFNIETMVDPEIGVGKLAIGLDFLRKRPT